VRFHLSSSISPRSHNYRRLRSRDSSRRKIASRRHHNENSNLPGQPDNGPIVVMNLSLWSPNFSSTVYNAARHARGRAFAATRLHVDPSMCIYVNERWRKSDKQREREREREREEGRGEVTLHIVDTGVHRITYINHISRYTYCPTM